MINAPFLASAAWAMVKVFLDEKTRKKIHIIGSNYQKTIYNEIDRELLPEFLGGTVVDVFPKSKAPWEPYIEKCFERRSWWPTDMEKAQKSSDPLVRGKQMVKELNQQKTDLITPDCDNLSHPNNAKDSNEAWFDLEDDTDEGPRLSSQSMSCLSINGQFSANHTANMSSAYQSKDNGPHSMRSARDIGDRFTSFGFNDGRQEKGNPNWSIQVGQQELFMGLNEESLFVADEDDDAMRRNKIYTCKSSRTNLPR